MTQEHIKAIARIVDYWGDLGEPTIRGSWATWDQQGSRGVMTHRIEALRAAGYIAFFSARDRRWGVKVSPSGDPEMQQ